MLTRLAALLACALLTTRLPAQVRIVEPAALGSPAPAPTAEADADAATMQQARRLLADDKGSAAQSLLDKWIKRHKSLDEEADNRHAPEAYYLRGNAKLLQDEEYDALYDYEEVVRHYPQSEFFANALERELDVARLYLNGRGKPGFFGRIDSGVPEAEEIIVRIGLRLPGSRLAERALLELADYYARIRDLHMAAETYDVFIRLFPRSEQRSAAMERRIYATIAQFKGPDYDGSVLRDAAIQLEAFQREFPARAQQIGLSDALIARLDESAAASKLSIARWYLRRNDAVSARQVLTRLVRTHSRTASAQDALLMIQAIDAGSRSGDVLKAAPSRQFSSTAGSRGAAP